MRIRVVSTCNADGWEQTGRRMAETFVQHWPAQATLEVYAEGFEPCIAAYPNVIARTLPEWFEAWKLRHAQNPDAHGRNKARFGKIDLRKGKPYSYRRDCVRFAHKVAALTDSALTTSASPDVPSWLIMCDADVVTHAPVTIDWLSSLVSDPRFYLAWLDRSAWYPECGFVVFNETHPAHVSFMTRFRDFYAGDHVFGLAETHDSFVLQQLVTAACGRREFPKPFSLSGNDTARRSSHPFVYSRLAERLDHAKGKFKAGGRTPRGYVKRGEAHWQ